mmetsp:Transcript_69718/g.215565  ORF Transcript_69718/g.215565 Transcript_69718/m.215565 type:complete len:207 (-) Transcript_69718:326-946(-)
MLRALRAHVQAGHRALAGDLRDPPRRLHQQQQSGPRGRGLRPHDARGLPNEPHPLHHADQGVRACRRGGQGHADLQADALGGRHRPGRGHLLHPHQGQLRCRPPRGGAEAPRRDGGAEAQAGRGDLQQPLGGMREGVRRGAGQAALPGHDRRRRAPLECHLLHPHQAIFPVQAPRRGRGDAPGGACGEGSPARAAALLPAGGLLPP